MGTRHLTRTGPHPFFCELLYCFDFETSFPGLRFFFISCLDFSYTEIPVGTERDGTDQLGALSVLSSGCVLGIFVL